MIACNISTRFPVLNNRGGFVDEIVKLLWERNECAIELLESRYSRVCRSIVARFLNDPQDVEEVLSDICMQIWNSIPLAKPRHFTAYLAKTARNAALHRMEHNKAQKRAAIAESIDELSECIPDKYASANIKSYEIRDTLDRFVRSLRKEERSYFVKRYYYGESIREIAQRHDCPESRVTVTIMRTRKNCAPIWKRRELKYERV